MGDRNKDPQDFRKIDQIISLEGDMLVKVDRTSMLTSLKSGSPFLNKKLWNFTSQLPEHYLIKGWNKNYLLKEAFMEYFPERFLDKSKKGFGVLEGSWHIGISKGELPDYSIKKLLETQGIFQLQKINKIVNDLPTGKWKILLRYVNFLFSKWCKAYYTVTKKAQGEKHIYFCHNSRI